MVFIGDVHGGFSTLNFLIKDNKKPYLQLGDMGVGFHGYPYPKRLHNNFKFIRGNHDSPEICHTHSNFLGDFGYLEKQQLFFISGGYSIDKDMRTIGLDWWEDEELNYTQMLAAIDLYNASNPKIVVSHECPTIIKYMMLNAMPKLNITSRTEQALTTMFDNHKPETWLFGHYHQTRVIQEDTTKFICLGELEMYDIPELTWD